MTLKQMNIGKLFQALIIALTFVCSLGFANVKSVAAQEVIADKCQSRVWFNEYAVLAYELGMEDFELIAAKEAGQTIAAIATERGVAIQQLVDSYVDAGTTIIRDEEARGCLTAEEATARITALPTSARQLIGVDADIEPATQPEGHVVFLPLLMN